MAKQNKKASEKDVSEILDDVAEVVEKQPSKSLKSAMNSNAEIKNHSKFDKFKKGNK